MTVTEEQAKQALAPGKLPDGTEDFFISDESWVEIEKAYGHALDPKTTRPEILQVTTSFVLFEPFERKAAPLAEAESRVQEIERSAKAFYLALFGRPRGPAAAFVDAAVAEHFQGRMPQLHELLLSLGPACNSVLAEVESSPGHREGAAWDRWIRDLTTILDAADLPTTASKGRGKSKSDSPSAFVSLVLELQNCVPEEARRHNTPDSIATAINRARKRLRVKT